jgi:hypothetical protein|tara:strand:+ start:34 stop:570 length:537 start_codon:yes stop_codon:yes gene_type:complete
MPYSKEYYLKNFEEIQRKKKIYRLKNREKINKQQKEYQTEYRKNHKEDIKEYNNFYANTENGFLHNLWASVKSRCKKHNRINEFKDFDEFYNHWLKQKDKYGMKCPAIGIEMTTIRKIDGAKHRRHHTNISVDRILSTKGYSHQNLIFTSWEYNSAKKNFTPEMAKAFLRIVGERYEI